MKVLVLQHIACETAGTFADVLAERGATLDAVEVDAGEALPWWGEYDALIAMGGPMSANDDAELPWLTEEKRMIGEAVRAGRPFLGVCLGAQLLAAALGARVHPAPAPEVGVAPVELTDAGRDDPLFSALREPLPALHWHGDTFELPAGATLLATTTVCRNQAYRYGRHAYGVQFHLEVTPERAGEWGAVPEYAESARRALGAGGLERLVADVERRAGEIEAAGRTLAERFGEVCVGAAR